MASDSAALNIGTTEVFCSIDRFCVFASASATKIFALNRAFGAERTVRAPNRGETVRGAIELFYARFSAIARPPKHLNF